MSSRIYHPSYAQNTLIVDYTVSVQPQGTGAPVFYEGDTPGASVGTWGTITRTGVGTFTWKSKDPFPGFVAFSMGFSHATQSSGWTYDCMVVKNADSTWSVNFTTYNGGTATDTAANASNVFFLYISLRNSTVNP